MLGVNGCACNRDIGANHGMARGRRMPDSVPLWVSGDVEWGCNRRRQRRALHDGRVQTRGERSEGRKSVDIAVLRRLC